MNLIPAALCELRVLEYADVQRTHAPHVLTHTTITDVENNVHALPRARVTLTTREKERQRGTQRKSSYQYKLLLQPYQETEREREDSGASRHNRLNPPRRFYL